MRRPLRLLAGLTLLWGCGGGRGDAADPARLARDPIFDVDADGVDFEELEQLEGRDGGPDARPVAVIRRGTSDRPAAELAAELRDIAVAEGWTVTHVRCGDDEYTVEAAKAIDPNGAGLWIGTIGSAEATTVRVEAHASPSTQNTIAVPDRPAGPDCLGSLAGRSAAPAHGRSTRWAP